MSTDAAWWDLPSGMPTWLQALFWLAFAAMVLTCAQTVAIAVAAVLGRRGQRRPAQRGPAAGSAESDFLWVFLVPALNEEVTIADSVARLQRIRATHKVMLVIDDGSDDGTAAVLAGIDDPALRVLTRHLPEARRGKAAALNAGYAHVRDRLLSDPAYAGFDPTRTVVAVVDADGRLDEDGPAVLAAHFADPAVGGVQVLVRIYNRTCALTRVQDLEFGVFGHLMQAGRARWGSANMGGNGQFNRLAALESVRAADGPWRDRLTEDQDLGVRLVQRGWRSVQENRVSVHQQGLTSLRRLYRQRTRWAQGAWQALALMPRVGAMPHPRRARLDAVVYLASPVLQLVVAVELLLAAAYDVASGTDPFSSHAAPLLVLLLPAAVAFVPALVIAGASRAGSTGRLPVSLGSGLLYPLYTWLLLPTLLLALARQLSGATSWAKTAREPLGATQA